MLSLKSSSMKNILIALGATERVVKIINKGLYMQMSEGRVLMITAEEFIRQAYSSFIDCVSMIWLLL